MCMADVDFLSPNADEREEIVRVADKKKGKRIVAVELVVMDGD